MRPALVPALLLAAAGRVNAQSGDDAARKQLAEHIECRGDPQIPPGTLPRWIRVLWAKDGSSNFCVDRDSITSTGHGWTFWVRMNHFKPGKRETKKRWTKQQQTRWQVNCGERMLRILGGTVTMSDGDLIRLPTKDDEVPLSPDTPAETVAMLVCSLPSIESRDGGM